MKPEIRTYFREQYQILYDYLAELGPLPFNELAKAKKYKIDGAREFVAVMGLATTREVDEIKEEVRNEIDEE